MGEDRTLYERVGGYDAIYGFTEHFIARLMNHDEIGVIWDHM